MRRHMHRRTRIDIHTHRRIRRHWYIYIYIYDLYVLYIYIYRCIYVYVCTWVCLYKFWIQINVDIGCSLSHGPSVPPAFVLPCPYVFPLGQSVCPTLALSLALIDCSSCGSEHSSISLHLCVARLLSPPT